MDVVEADRTLGNDEDVSLLDWVEVVVKSGGVPNEAALARAARERGTRIWSDAEVAYRILPNPLLAVTGTKGKTTTTALLAEITGAPAAGNIGLALCALDGEVEPGALVVAELSSFQLEHVETFRPRIAVLLNLEADHLDRHGTREAYAAAKLRIFDRQQADDVAVVPQGFGAIPGRARRIEFSADDPLPAEPRLRGRHNRANAAAAVAAARAAGVSEDAIAGGLERFRPVPHRLETVGEAGGVVYVNDSIATNVLAARAALAAYADEPVHLIAGGRAKGESFEPLAAAVGPNVRVVYLVGEADEALAAALAPTGVPFERSGDLRTAVAAAAANARPGDVVLLSPACASFDQYESFEQRGEEFRELVRTMEA
ncbi:MAG: UDP-N-acetylmuramoyl-L-alanine--D-glutamate ligase [Thermoleophilia bacterium]|nr:UDP-N-acetylmuramoyl-L-alanine--D-glutamate ligase [Thermoleophilia bacterium]